MAPREHSSSRHREAGKSTKKSSHKKSKSREHSNARPSADPSSPTGNDSGTGSSAKAPQLSLNAIAQLNDYNTRHPAEESKTAAPKAKARGREPKTKTRPPVARDKYVAIGLEDDSPKQDRGKKREAKTDDEREAKRERRQKRGAATDDEGTKDSPRRKHRGAVSEDRDTRKSRRGKDQTVGDDGLVYGYLAVAKNHKQKDGRPKKGKGGIEEGGGLKRRVVSGAMAEEGRITPEIRGGASSKHSSWDSLEGEKRLVEKKSWWARLSKKKKIWIIVAILVILLIVIIAAAVSASQKKSDNNKSALDGMSESDIPAAARGTYLDPFTWHTTTDFNVTYTNQTVGDLPIEGLFSNWDDSAQANENVPALNKDWGDYSKTPARGVNLGGWLNLEPFIKPSLFSYNSDLGIIDEYTLCSYLGPSKAASTLEDHYANFVTEQTFADIQAAGLDHVRIPYGYWAVQTYNGDPYVFRTSWRYLLRGIEYARKYGLRVNLDLHGLPGSQNGWNHSGRQGAIGWFNGTDGDLNAQRSLELHDRLTKFFAQDRYKNIITFYGLVNEPKMTFLDVGDVLDWTVSAYKLVRKNGMTANVVIGDGFMGLTNWKGQIQGHDGLVLDAHQYVIFNNEQIVYTHKQKVKYACSGWTEQTEQSMDTSTGFGAIMVAEWSQADSDCAQYLNNVGWGNRWTGTYDAGNDSINALTPMCPTKDDTCQCSGANSDPSGYSDEYKTFLKMFAEAQMFSFEKGWGWWYWTWDTESNPLWSYKQGLAAGILPTKAYQKDFNCDLSAIPDFSSAGLAETY